MEYVYSVLSILLIVITFLPKIPLQHWIFRIASFGKIHITVVLIILFILGFILQETSILFYVIQSLLAVTIAYNASILFPYLLLKKKNAPSDCSPYISVISVNVYQFNKKYEQLINLVHKYQPDILLTIESNKDWEQALTVLDDTYTTYKKVAIENTYGMHFYTKLNVTSLKVHFFVSDDLPCIEAKIKIKNGDEFVFFGIHPPPASPTEEPNSKEKDGELLSIAKKAKKETLPTVVIGDFNSVAWSRITKLFTKISGLQDARIGRGFISTFPANYRFFKIPLDLMYHTSDIYVRSIKTLENINSDHLPLYTEFCIHREQNNYHSASQDSLDKADEMIEEGDEEESNNR